MSSSHCGDLIVPAVEASMGLLDRAQWWSGQPCVPSRRVERHLSQMPQRLTCTASYRAVYTHPGLASLLGVEDILAHVQYVNISMVESFYSLRHAHKMPFCRRCLLGLEGKKATIPIGALLEVSGHCIAWALIYYGTSLACFPFLV
jgi:hypothetical protein